MTILKYCQIIMEESYIHTIRISWHRSPENFFLFLSLFFPLCLLLSVSVYLYLPVSLFLCFLESSFWGSPAALLWETLWKDPFEEELMSSAKSQQGPEASRQTWEWLYKGILLQLTLRVLQPRQHLDCHLIKGFETNPPKLLLDPQFIETVR